MGRRVIALLLVATACGPVIGSGDDETTTDPATTDPSSSPTIDPTDPSNPTSLSTSGNPTDPTTDPSITASTTANPTSATTVDPSDTTQGDDTCSFIVCPDVIIEPRFCDIWAQDCLRDEKCMPWASDGGTYWNDSRCSPLDPSAAQPGDTCTVEGGPATGVDNCDIGTMCMFVDPDTNQGTCIPFCMGNEDNPVCEDPATACAIEFDGEIASCLPSCDPLVQDCAEGGCHGTPGGSFVCAPTIGIGLGAGQTCGHNWDCANGYTCYDGAHVPDCEGARCCAPFCDLSVPGQCEELTCVPWFEDDQSPGGPSPIGVCIIE